jgi:virulence-associated protein VagC
MNKITTKLVKDGNSTAVRIPKVALEMSGISGRVELFVEEGTIIIKKLSHFRDSWAKAIVADKPTKDKELEDWESLSGDGLGD